MCQLRSKIADESKWIVPCRADAPFGESQRPYTKPKIQKDTKNLHKQ